MRAGDAANWEGARPYPGSDAQHEGSHTEGKSSRLQTHSTAKGPGRVAEQHAFYSEPTAVASPATATAIAARQRRCIAVH